MVWNKVFENYTFLQSLGYGLQTPTIKETSFFSQLFKKF